MITSRPPLFLLHPVTGNNQYTNDGLSARPTEQMELQGAYKSLNSNVCGDGFYWLFYYHYNYATYGHQTVRDKLSSSFSLFMAYM